MGKSQEANVIQVWGAKVVTKNENSSELQKTVQYKFHGYAHSYNSTTRGIRSNLCIDRQ